VRLGANATLEVRRRHGRVRLARGLGLNATQVAGAEPLAVGTTNLANA
jgi:hypothetical protein